MVSEPLIWMVLTCPAAGVKTIVASKPAVPHAILRRSPFIAFSFSGVVDSLRKVAGFLDPIIVLGAD
jgi:hypothetical protein